MLKLVNDQAEGLRRLLGKQGLRVIRLNAARRGVGQTTVAVNLAAALAEKGRDVLILDEAGGAGNACELLGLRPRTDFGRVLRGESRIEQAVTGGNGIAVLPLGDGLQRLESLDTQRRRRLVEHIEGAQLRCDVVIVDTCAGAASRLLAPAAAGIDDVLMLGASGGALTEAYAWLKSCGANYGSRRQRVLFNRVRDEAQARGLFDNLAGTARRYLGTELELFGVLSSDDALKRAGQLAVPAIHGFPAASAAIRLRQLGQCAMEFPRGRQQFGNLGDLFHALARGAPHAAVATKHRPAMNRDFGLAGVMAG